ncbi:MAG: BON domain-containing protein [Acidobacteria bacterium]|nr:BON domain-containing protein [Acidobacteriota bacterium]
MQTKNYNLNESKMNYKSDAEIRREVLFHLRHSLEGDKHVPSNQILTTVSNSWVTLEGKAEHDSQRENAEHAVCDLAGVSGVTNQIKVTSPVDPEKVRFLIENVLELRADREANRIEVKVEEGEVTLTGEVPSWNAKKAILGAVGHMPGVTAIDDRLIIEPYVMLF